jgi:YgiT-type zinc finger domain-containing protein
MRCGFQSCPGVYEAKLISLALPQNGMVAVIQNVPAEVCSFCGDTQFSADTSRQIARTLDLGVQPVGAASVYDYAQGASQGNGHKPANSFISSGNTQRLAPPNHRFPGCPGEHEAQAVALLKQRNGQDVVVDNVPALVCDTCGSTFYEARTIYHIEKLLESQLKHNHAAPLYDFAQGATPQTAGELVTAER